MTFPSDFSRANLKVGRSSPERSGSGTLFMKLGSPAAAGFAAATAAAASAEPIRTSRRCTLDMMIISMMALIVMHRNRAPARAMLLALYAPRHSDHWSPFLDDVRNGAS